MLGTFLILLFSNENHYINVTVNSLSKKSDKSSIKLLSITTYAKDYISKLGRWTNLLFDRLILLTNLYWPFANYEISVNYANCTLISYNYGKSNKGKLPKTTFIHSNNFKWDNYKEDGMLLKTLSLSLNTLKLSKFDFYKNWRSFILLFSREISSNWPMFTTGKSVS